MIIEINESIFEDEINTNIPVLIDFYSDWCGACESMYPLIEELAEEYKEKVKFLKVNTPENRNIGKKYRVMGLPTIIFLKDTEVIKVMNGSQSKESLAQALNEII